jgi:hypothetical protein
MRLIAVAARAFVRDHSVTPGKVPVFSIWLLNLVIDRHRHAPPIRRVVAAHFAARAR